jgi:hypothetical protein
MCSVIRDALNAPSIALGERVDCVLIKSGSCPRASKQYADDEHITLEALQMEIQSPNEIFVYKVPGRVLKHGLREQWAGGIGNPAGQPNPGIAPPWLQLTQRTLTLTLTLTQVSHHPGSNQPN